MDAEIKAIEEEFVNQFNSRFTALAKRVMESPPTSVEAIQEIHKEIYEVLRFSDDINKKDEYRRIDDALQSELVALESRLNDRIDRSATDLKRFIGRAVAVGAVCTMGVVAVWVSIF